MNPPIQKGERVVVAGWTNLDVRVADVIFQQQELRWVLVLDWGEHGVSRVYDHDEGKTWYRYAVSN